MHEHATNFIEDLTKLSMQLMQIISGVHVGMEKWFSGKGFCRYVLILTLKLLLTGRRKRQDMEGLLERKSGHIFIQEMSKHVSPISLENHFFHIDVPKFMWRSWKKKKRKESKLGEKAPPIDKLHKGKRNLFGFE